MKVYIIRHGQSEANAMGVHCGQTDYALTEKGKKEAEEVRKLLRGIKFDKVYSSDLIRANMTGKIALEGYEIEQLSLIREVSVGSIAGEDIIGLEKKLGEELIRNKKNFDFRPYGGENSDMIMERASKFLDMLVERGDENVAVFTHAGFYKAMLSVVLGKWIPPHQLVCSNCSLSILKYDECYKLYAWNIQNEENGDKVW